MAQPGWLQPTGTPSPSWLQPTPDPGTGEPPWLDKTPDKSPDPPILRNYHANDPTPPDAILSQWLPFIDSAAKQYRVPDWVVKFTIGQETGQNTDYRLRLAAKNTQTGALGPGQFLPSTAKALGIDPTNPQQAIFGIARYLSTLKPQDGTWRDAVAGYNMGGGGYAAARAKGSPLPLETQKYLANFDVAAKNYQQRQAARMAHVVTRVNDQPSTLAPKNRSWLATDDPTMQEGVTGPIGGVISPQMAHSGLMEFAGHQDLPFILANALQRDNQGKYASFQTVLEEMHNPRSQVYNAWHLYLRDPAQAMDEYGLGADAQRKWMESHVPGFDQSTQDKLERSGFVNAIMTFGGEQLNPMALAEGFGLGKGASWLGSAARETGVLTGLQKVATAFGLGSPLYGLSGRGGVDATSWAKGAIASLNAPHTLLGMKATDEVVQQIFGGLTPEAQTEVVRLYQGLKPNVQFEKEYGDLSRRAKLLEDDIGQVESQQRRVGTLPVEKTFKGRYFPMSRSYDFGPQWELEQQLKGEGAPGGGGISQHKIHKNIDESIASGDMDPDFLAANNYRTFRRQRLQRVSFEDSINAAPPSLRRDVTAADYMSKLGTQPGQPPQYSGIGYDPKYEGGPKPTASYVDPLHPSGLKPASPATAGEEMGMQRQRIQEAMSMPPSPERADALASAGWFKPTEKTDTADAKFNQFTSQVQANRAKYTPGHPLRLEETEDPLWVHAINMLPNPSQSPALAKSMIAPELWDFLRGNDGLQRYISTSGTYLPGQEQTWVGKYVAAMRNMVVSNFIFHPAVNVAGNDAAARGMYNLGGATFARGGYAYNAALSVATQAGLRNPEAFVGGAAQYSEWLGRAMRAGGVAEFGEARLSALGGEYARTMTVPQKGIIQRLDRALTKAGDFNRDRTFGQKGEQAFAVSLFKDAVEKGGMSDAQAGQVVREALGDYYNFDPRSPWSSFMFFMPWLKGNTKFWANALIRRPQYALGTAHAMRNYGLQTDQTGYYEGKYPTGDFTIPIGGVPFTAPFVGRDVGHYAEAGRRAIAGDVTGAVAPIEQILAGRAQPLVRGASDLVTTINAYFSSDVQGPETNWNMITNPKAPPEAQFHQAAGYFASHFIPIPLFTYAMQDAARRGLTKDDIGRALLTAGGVGYFGDEKLDTAQQRQLGTARKNYQKAYYRYQHNGDMDELRDSWDRYTDRLKSIGVLQ